VQDRIVACCNFDREAVHGSPSPDVAHGKDIACVRSRRHPVFANAAELAATPFAPPGVPPSESRTVAGTTARQARTSGRAVRRVGPAQSIPFAELEWSIRPHRKQSHPFSDMTTSRVIRNEKLRTEPSCDEASAVRAIARAFEMNRRMVSGSVCGSAQLAVARRD
jgi:hypothetical protein